jgi:hypothetical protein
VRHGFEKPQVVLNIVPALFFPRAGLNIPPRASDCQFTAGPLADISGFALKL